MKIRFKHRRRQCRVFKNWGDALTYNALMGAPDFSKYPPVRYQKVI